MEKLKDLFWLLFIVGIVVFGLAFMVLAEDGWIYKLLQ